MNKQHLELRLQHVSDNLNTCLDRIHRYEVELINEDDPNRQSLYQLRIERLESAVEKHKGAYEKLKVQYACLSEREAESLAGSFQQTATSLTSVRGDLEALLAKIVVTAIEPNRLSEDEMTYVLEHIRQALVTLPQDELRLPQRDQLQEILDDTSLGVKHKLKYSVPIIPQLLNFETEDAIGSTDNLGKIWNWLKVKLLK